MYSITKGDITIREMKTSDVMPLVRLADIPQDRALLVINGLKKQIREKNEMSDLLFVILYKNKAVGKIDIAYTDRYCKEPKYKGIKTDGDMTIQIPSVDISNKIASNATKMFIELCKEEGFVDVLGIPKEGPNGLLIWKPMRILPAAM